MPGSLFLILPMCIYASSTLTLLTPATEHPSAWYCSNWEMVDCFGQILETGSRIFFSEILQVIVLMASGQIKWNSVVICAKECSHTVIEGG
uniref:Secreted protein n=1 Tax=Triticum urartu TaxID=4572 RepID=A0A8R7QPN5_TRIUA